MKSLISEFFGVDHPIVRGGLAKTALVEADERSTTLVMRTLRNTERVLHTPTVDQVLEVEARGNTKIEDIAPYVAGTASKTAVLEKGIMDSRMASPAGRSGHPESRRRA